MTQTEPLKIAIIGAGEYAAVCNHIFFQKADGYLQAWEA